MKFVIKGIHFLGGSKPLTGSRLDAKAIRARTPLWFYSLGSILRVAGSPTSPLWCVCPAERYAEQPFLKVISKKYRNYMSICSILQLFIIRRNSICGSSTRIFDVYTFESVADELLCVAWNEPGQVIYSHGSAICDK